MPPTNAITHEQQDALMGKVIAALQQIGLEKFNGVITALDVATTACIGMGKSLQDVEFLTEKALREWCRVYTPGATIYTRYRNGECIFEVVYTNAPAAQSLVSSIFEGVYR